MRGLSTDPADAAEAAQDAESWLAVLSLHGDAEDAAGSDDDPAPDEPVPGTTGAARPADPLAPPEE